MKNPPTSVQVVINIVAEVAGSLPRDFIISGITAPATDAIIRLPIIERARTRPSIGSLLISIATRATIAPLIRPLITPAPNSLNANRKLRCV